MLNVLCGNSSILPRLPQFIFTARWLTPSLNKYSERIPGGIITFLPFWA